MARLVRKAKDTAPQEDEAFIQNVHRIAHLVADKKAKDIKAYDVRGLTVVADAFLICTATSEPQLKAVYNSVKEGMKDAGVPVLRTEGTFHSGWVLLDYGDVIFHIFREQARDFYDLDGMWGDAKEIKVDVD